MEIRIIKASGNEESWYKNEIGEIFEVIDPREYGFEQRTDDIYYVEHPNNRYDDCISFVNKEDCEIVTETTPEPSPQLAGIYDGLSKLALEITELKRKVGANTNDIAFLDEKRLTSESLSPLQLAILNAKDTPADVKLLLVVEAGRLEAERQAIVNG